MNKQKEANMAAWAESVLHHDPDADVSELTYDARFADDE